MNLLKQTAVEQEKINAFLDESGEIIKKLDEYRDYADISDLKKIRENFKTKTDDFDRDDRKLNIGIIGQVKAGKSTFLNTLLFDGKDILPSARTPKTAVLTKIEYSEENSIFIDYYTNEEWAILERFAREDMADNEHIAAKEIVSMAEKSGIDPSDYISKGSETIRFDSAEELMGKLNNYVGENGMYTPLVKNVTIMLDDDNLKEISVVDTPGLNDAIASRTDKTRKFIEKCDVVFFLSRASAFLDGSDMKLVTAQLPSKGVDNLILVCSRFDESMFDVLKGKKTAPVLEVIKETKSDIISRAQEIICHKSDEAASYGMDSAKTRIFEQCKNPVFVSSILYNMSCKNQEDYSKFELWLKDKFSKKCEITQDIMKEIGNFDIVKNHFEKVISEKDSTLQRKAKNFVPNVKAEWKEAMRSVKSFAESRLNTLETGDREALKKQKKFIGSKISAIKASLETVLGELLLFLESGKTECLRKLRENSRECSMIEERQGTEWYKEKYIVGQKRFLFWKWGGHTETHHYPTTYAYLAASDALENIRNFGYDACSDIEETFRKSVAVKDVKRRLIQTILDNFDSSDENFDINYFRHIIESTLNQLEFPVVKIDIEPFLNSISSKFSGEIRDSGERSELQNLLAESISSLFDKVTNIFAKEVSSFKTHINDIKNNFSDVLLKNINDDFETLQKQFENKESEILKYKEFIGLLIA